MFEPLPEHPEFYVEKFFFEAIEDGKMIRVPTYQPTVKGLEVLAKHYNAKHGIDIHILDQSEIENKSFGGHFQHLKRFLDEHSEEFEKKIGDNKQIGIVMACGTQHAIPLMISKDAANNKMMIIFDSVLHNGGREYYEASMLLDYKFNLLLNAGTRQRDEYSCITDSIAILTDALQEENLAQYLLDHKIPKEESKKLPSKLKSDHWYHYYDGIKERYGYSDDVIDKIIWRTQRQKDVRFFHMPEKLLKTAQLETFVADSEPDMGAIISSKGKNLEQKRKEKYSPLTSYGTYSNYLHIKSWKYAKIISQTLEEESKSVPASSPIIAAAHPVAVTAEEKAL
jgi:hypothetical protein